MTLEADAAAFAFTLGAGGPATNRAAAIIIAAPALHAFLTEIRSLYFVVVGEISRMLEKTKVMMVIRSKRKAKAGPSLGTGDRLRFARSAFGLDRGFQRRRMAGKTLTKAVILLAELLGEDRASDR
uniref:hypothetical protein n=1 Tax=Nonomuraea bangladeshensis TaxID=404385 RepID=UPI003F492C47